MRYHFHLRESGGYVPDEEGLELDTLDDVRRAALKGARSIMADEVLHGRLPLRAVLEVKDGRGNPVLDLAFRDTVMMDG